MRHGLRLPPFWKRRVLGFAWLSAWISLLYLVAAPWRDLGGIEDERVRWLEYVVLLSALSIGFAVGRLGREAALAAPGRTHARFVRYLLYPPAVLTAAALVALSVLGGRGSIGVVVTGFLAYWAGLDLAFGAVPMMEGRSYRFERPLDPEPDTLRRLAEPDDRWVPPWERP